MGFQRQAAAPALLGGTFPHNELIAASVANGETFGSFFRSPHPIDQWPLGSLGLAVFADFLGRRLGEKDRFRQWGFGAVIAPADARLNFADRRIEKNGHADGGG